MVVTLMWIERKQVNKKSVIARYEAIPNYTERLC
jgi:hypothetical protein